MGREVTMARTLVAVHALYHGANETDGGAVTLMFDNGEKVTQEYGRRSWVTATAWDKGRTPGVRLTRAQEGE